MNSSWKQLGTDRHGGIEGLPLQLMIVILVATMGTAVIIGWMGNIETPHAISEVMVSDDCVDATSTGGSGSIISEYTVTGFSVLVYDQDKNPLEGALVLLSGLGVEDVDGKPPHETTDKDGRCEIKDFTVDFPGKTGFLNISVSKPGYSENNSAQVMVIKG